MADKLTDIATLWGGTKVQDHVHLLACYDDFVNDKFPPTAIYDVGKQAFAVDNVEWSARAIAPDPYQTNASIIIGMNGEYARFYAGKVEELGTVHDSLQLGTSQGTLRNIHCIDSQVYICGGRQQIYRMTPEYQWTRFDAGIVRADPNKLSVFEFMHRSVGGLYVAGAQGEAWQYDSQRWQPLPMPTNLRLTAACEDSEGNTIMVGQAGALLRGQGQAWELVFTDDSIKFLWDVAWFKGQIFATSNSILYELVDDVLIPVNFSDQNLLQGSIPFTFYKLFCDENYLYSIGSKDWLRYDGTEWTRII